MATIVYLFICWMLLSSCIRGARLRSGQISCSFDDGLCDWLNDDKDVIWRNNSGQTDDRTSGPLNDHTCGNYKGQYVFISGSDVTLRNRSAVLQSPDISLANNASLTFWFNMNGIGIGSLSCVRVEMDRKKTDILWKREGRQGRGWLNATISLTPGQFLIEFVATARLPYGSDLALDDVQLSSESRDVYRTHCILPPTTTARTTSTPRATTSSQATSTGNPGKCLHTDTSLVTLPGSCDFEHGFCSNIINTDSASSRISWVRQNKPYLYGRHGIQKDHTFHDNKSTSGFFVRFENNMIFLKKGDSASIETPPIYANYTCVHFWYNMPSNYSNLNVSVRYNNTLREIWRRDTTFSGYYTGWHEVILSLHQEFPFTLVFLAYDKEHLNTVGIDDLSIRGTNLSSAVVIPTLPGDKTTVNVTLRPLNSHTLSTSMKSTAVVSSTSSTSTSPSSATLSKITVEAASSSLSVTTISATTLSSMVSVAADPSTSTSISVDSTPQTKSPIPVEWTKSISTGLSSSSQSPPTSSAQSNLDSSITPSASAIPGNDSETHTKPSMPVASTKSTPTILPSSNNTPTHMLTQSKTLPYPTKIVPTSESKTSMYFTNAPTTFQPKVTTNPVERSKNKMTNIVIHHLEWNVTDNFMRNHSKGPVSAEPGDLLFNPKAENKYRLTSTIAGSVVGAVVFIVLAALIGYVWYTRSMTRRHSQAPRPKSLHSITMPCPPTLATPEKIELRFVKNIGSVKVTSNKSAGENMNGNVSFTDNNLPGHDETDYNSHLQNTVYIGSTRL